MTSGGEENLTARYFHELDNLHEALRSWKQLIRSGAALVDSSAYVSGRVKSHRSVLGKAYRKPGVVRDWGKFGDLVALKAVFPTSDGVNRFTDWVSDRSDWSPSLDRKEGEPHELTYKSMQFDLRSSDILDSRGEPLKVELQVRTAATDAWYVVDHRLQYKGIVELPKELQRKLRRLLVLTELFDEEVDQVIARQVELPEYAASRIYENAARIADELFDGQIRTSRPEGLLELLLSGYGDSEFENLSNAIETFSAQHRITLVSVFARHQYKSANFVEERDWIYGEPEALLIAHRSATRPSQLRALVEYSDFEEVLFPMINEFEKAFQGSSS